MGERVTKAELARRFGIDESAVRKHIKRGVYREGRDGLIDADDARLAWEASSDPDKVLQGIAGGAAVSNDPQARTIPETSLTRARTAQSVLAAQRQKLELDKARGLLISKEDARRAVAAAVTIITERLDGAAGQIGPRVAGNPSAAECEKIAREIINSIRADIAGLADAVEGVANDG